MLSVIALLAGGSAVGKERHKDVYDRLVAQWNDWNATMSKVSYLLQFHLLKATGMFG